MNWVAGYFRIQDGQQDSQGLRPESPEMVTQASPVHHGPGHRTMKDAVLASVKLQAYWTDRHFGCQSQFLWGGDPEVLPKAALCFTCSYISFPQVLTHTPPVSFGILSHWFFPPL